MKEELWCSLRSEWRRCLHLRQLLRRADLQGGQDPVEACAADLQPIGFNRVHRP